MASGRLKCSTDQTSEMTCTPIVENYEVLDALDLLPSPDPRIDGGDWFQSYSLNSLRLTLEDIVEDCKVPNKHVLEEFPYSHHLSVLGSAGAVLPSTSRPLAHLDSEKLQLKCSQLKSLVNFYENRIDWLSTGSRMYFGHLNGSNVALLVEASDHLFQECEEYKGGLKMLIDEQLVQKEAVYLIQFGSEVRPTKPECLRFSAKKNRCSELASHWLSSLGGSGGCDMLGALRVALRLKQVDTICVVLSSRPNQPFEVLLDHLVERLSGCDVPRLHVVAFNSTGEETAAFLSKLAMETGGHCHRFTSTFHEDQKGYEVEDTDISRIQEEIKRTKKVLNELKALESGIVGDSLLGVLRELYLTTEWPDNDGFPPSAPPSGEHSTPCSTQQWLEQHGLTRHRLGIYQFLAPNAYPQLETFVNTIERRVASQVYEVMPLFEWSDGSRKYLHVDVPLMERYQRQLERFIGDTLQVRLNWLLSGSRVPFGVITEQRVLVAFDCSYLVLAQILVLQQHLRTLLEDQLSHVTAFNLLRFGKECCTWRTGFAEPSCPNLRDAWEWVLGMSPAGSCNLLSALRLVFESEMVSENSELEDVGLYLIVSAMPDQDTDSLCSYVEQQVAGRGVTLHVVFYNTEPLATDLLIPGKEGGRWGDEGEMEECLRQIVKAGGGRFHHFKLSGAVEGTDITAMMDEVSEAQFYLKTASSVVANYREFCKRNVLPTPRSLSGGTTSPEHRARLAPPLYPRQTNTSLGRMNTCVKHLDDKEEAVRRETPNSKKYIKTRPFYLDQGLCKGVAWELLDHTPPSKLKSKPLIPNKEEHLSSIEWLSRYGLNKLGLGIETIIPASGGCHGDQGKKRTVYKHINHHGEVVELFISHHSLRGYAKKLQTALNRYQSRLEWLLEDNRKFFSVIVEKKVLFLLDVSSSMATSLQEVVEALAQLLLLWDTCTVHRVKSFNIVTYASTVAKWQEELVPVGDHCAQAVQWLRTVRAGGASCLLEALKVSFQSGATGIYLVTDGIPGNIPPAVEEVCGDITDIHLLLAMVYHELMKETERPTHKDHTHEFLLNQLPLLRKSYGNGWVLNTVAFHCSDPESQHFLKSLATRSGGRYHSYPLPSGLVAKQRDITAGEPTLGDDVWLLVDQVLLARNHLADIQTLL